LNDIAAAAKAPDLERQQNCFIAETLNSTIKESIVLGTVTGDGAVPPGNKDETTEPAKSTLLNMPDKVLLATPESNRDEVGQRGATNNGTATQDSGSPDAAIEDTAANLEDNCTFEVAQREFIEYCTDLKDRNRELWETERVFLARFGSEAVAQEVPRPCAWPML